MFASGIPVPGFTYETVEVCITDVASFVHSCNGLLSCFIVFSSHRTRILAGLLFSILYALFRQSDLSEQKYPF